MSHSQTDGRTDPVPDVARSVDAAVPSKTRRRHVGIGAAIAVAVIGVAVTAVVVFSGRVTPGTVYPAGFADGNDGKTVDVQVPTGRVTLVVSELADQAYAATAGTPKLRAPLGGGFVQISWAADISRPNGDLQIGGSTSTQLGIVADGHPTGLAELTPGADYDTLRGQVVVALAEGTSLLIVVDFAGQRQTLDARTGALDTGVADPLYRTRTGYAGCAAQSSDWGRSG